MKRVILAVIVCAYLLIPAMASADNQARDYLPAPPGTILSILYWNHISSNSLFSGGNKIADIDLSENIGIWREVYYFQLGPFLAAVDTLVPFGNANLSLGSGIDRIDQSASGVGAPIFLGTLWFVNRTSSKTYLAFSPYVFLPLGQYNPTGLSIGSNRWQFKEEMNFSQGFEVIPNHNAYFEVTAAGDFYTANNNVGPTGATLTQNPVFTLESHLSYDITKDWWIAADFYGHWGGATTVGDFSDPSLTKVNGQTIGGTLAYNLTPGWQVLFQYKGDVAVTNGSQNQTFLVRLLYATDFRKLCQ